MEPIERVRALLRLRFVTIYLSEELKINAPIASMPIIRISRPRQSHLIMGWRLLQSNPWDPIPAALHLHLPLHKAKNHFQAVERRRKLIILSMCKLLLSQGVTKGGERRVPDTGRPPAFQLLRSHPYIRPQGVFRR